MADEPSHTHSFNWKRSGDDSVNECACGEAQARLIDAYKEPKPTPPEPRPRGRDL